ncbi:MAG TPA: ABC transporter substrate-binding protein [Dehalococcoidia bacterium]|nr:ABC transporter substrate-binding protein [Dehalococcoidia bacterium]
MHTRWPVFAALVLGVSALAAISWIVLAQARGATVPASGGHYVEGVTRAPERMNPLFAGANPVDADVASLVFSGLVRLGSDGTPLPDLAQRWEITGNGQSYVFHLRPGVAWQDGQPFDAQDVVFTFKAIADPGFKGDPALAQLMDGVIVTARDPLTVEFRLQQAYAPFLSYLNVGILPRHLLDGMDANQLFNAPFNAHPIGTGPFAFARHTAHGVELATNPTYYLGPPLISTMELRVYADESALADALRTHQVDGALLGPDTPRADIDFLATDPAFALRRLTTTAYNTVYLDTRAPLFADAVVRKALWQAINAQSLVDQVAGGRGQPIQTTIPKQSWAFTDATVPAFDPGAAARALEADGWPRGADGVRFKDGVRLAFTLSVPNDAQRVAIARNLADQWRAIGADVQVQPFAAATYIDDVLLPRKYQAALVAVDPGPDPDPYPFWHSSQIAPPGRNLANYADPAVDDVLQRARQTTDTARRKDLYALFAGYLIAAAPQIPLYSPVYIYVQATRVHGFSDTLLFSPASRFSSVAAWYINTTTR